MTRSLARFTVVFAGIVLSAALAVGQQVSELEASHVAEIHTGAVTEHIQLEEQGDQAVYRIRSRRANDSFEVEIDAWHGRLLSVQRLTDAGAESLYRWPGIRVVAHRGGALLGPPENTIPAIQKAIKLGADLIEIDIRQTADGHLVLMHDETVDRTTNGSGRVDEMSLAEIQELEIAHDGESLIRVPTLEQALLAMRGKIDPDLDFKGGSLATLLAIIRKLELEEHCTMYGAWNDCLSIVDSEPKIRIRPTADYPEQVPTLIRTLRPAMVNLDWHAVTEKSVRLAHLGGCHAFVNCLADADTDYYIRQAVRIGADYIQSDRPDVVVEILQDMGLRDERPPRGDVLATPLRATRLTYPLR